MSRPFQVEISESKEMLEKALKYATTASSKERLQMLYGSISVLQKASGR